MKYKNCKVDIISVKINLLDNVNRINFIDILKHPEILDKEKKISNKIIHYSILDETENYIIGFLRSTTDKDLPAKINKKTKIISKLNLNEEEGLAYGNIFLFSKELSCLFFEINKNSLYLDSFRKFLLKCYNDSNLIKDKIKFDIVFGTIFRKNEYQRALSMTSYKEFRMKVHQPGKLLEDMRRTNNSIDQDIESEFTEQLEKAAELNCEIAEIHYKAGPKKSNNLYRDKIEPLIRGFKEILGDSEIRQNIEVIEVVGYTVDNSTSKKPINLIGDVYYGSFRINVPRLDSTLQKKERTEKIIELYHKEHEVLKTFL